MCGNIIIPRKERKKGEDVMNANVPLELVAEKIGECVDFVRINLQQGTLLVDGLPVGYAYKKKEENKNYSYVVDPIRFAKYLKQLEEANKILYGD